jgi:hypothetical protein
MLPLILLLLAAQQDSLLVPNGWKAETLLRGSDIIIEHVSGASIIYRPAPARGLRDLDAVARQGVDRTMQPLGFATFGPALLRKLNGDAAIQYEIRGNRLSERRKLLYVGIQRSDGFYEMIYENSEAGFDSLLPEAERIGQSIELSSLMSERLGVNRVRLVNAAEAAFLKTHHRFGTLAELIVAKLLDADFDKPGSDYNIVITLAGRGYRVSALPASGTSGRWAFESRQDGVVRYASRAGLAPRGMAGKVVQ